MINKFSKAAVLVASLMSLFAVMASAAGAATWDTNKGSGTPAWNGAFTATAGPGTLTGPNAGLSCTSATATGTVAAASFAGSTWNNAVSGNIAFTSCKIGGTTYGVACTYGLNATSWSSGVTSGAADLVAASSHGCTVKLATTTVCNINGSIPATYTNSSGVLNVPAASSGLTTTNGSVSCPVGAGSASLTALPFTVTSTPKPSLTFTP
jgi:hypothetical protein